MSDLNDLLKAAQDLLKSHEAEKKNRPKKSGKGYEYVGNQTKQRYLMQKHLGRELPDWISVGFKDGNKSNFDIDNLEIRVRAGTPANGIPCPHCSKDLLTCLQSVGKL